MLNFTFNFALSVARRFQSNGMYFATPYEQYLKPVELSNNSCQSIHAQNVPHNDNHKQYPAFFLMQLRIMYLIHIFLLKLNSRLILFCRVIFMRLFLQSHKAYSISNKIITYFQILYPRSLRITAYS